MTTENNQSADDKSSNPQEDKKEKPLTLHNPLNPDDPRKITLEDVENEQKFKEALTERD